MNLPQRGENMKKEVYVSFKFRVKIPREEAERVYRVMRKYRENMKKIRVLAKYLMRQGYSGREAVIAAIQRYRMKNLINSTRWNLIRAYIVSKMFRADTLILLNRYGYRYSCYFMERDSRVFLRISGELDVLIPIKKTIYRAIKKRESWGWKPVELVLKFLNFTKRNGLFEVIVVFKVSVKKISIEDIREALRSSRLSLISVDINAIHGAYFGLFRVQDSELKLIGVRKTNVNWRLVEYHLKRKAELQSKLKKKGLSSREFRELRQLERKIGNLIVCPKRRGLGILRELIRREQSLGRKVVVVIENISEKDVQGMCNSSPKINRAIKWFMSGWQKRIQFLAKIEEAYFMTINKAFSSKKCPVCGKVMKYIDNRWLCCSQCNREYHRDVAALENLAKRALKKIKKHNTSLP